MLACNIIKKPQKGVRLPSRAVRVGGVWGVPLEKVWWPPVLLFFILVIIKYSAMLRL